MNCPLDGKKCNLAKPFHVTDITKNGVIISKVCANCPMLVGNKSTQNPVQVDPDQWMTEKFKEFFEDAKIKAKFAALDEYFTSDNNICPLCKGSLQDIIN